MVGRVGGRFTLAHTRTEHTHIHTQRRVYVADVELCNNTPISLNRTDCFPRR